MKKNIDKIITQKDGEYTCGAVAIKNFLMEIKEESKASVIKINNLIKKGNRTTALEVYSYLYAKHDLGVSMVFQPTRIQVRKALKQNSAIILIKSSISENHFCTIINYDKTFVYLTNMWDNDSEKYIPLKKIKWTGLKIYFLIGFLNN